MEGLIVLFLVAAIPTIWAVMTYNNFVRVKNHCTEAWSNIDTELKRRYELIPNLVSTVKGYASHERGLLEEIVALRNACAADHGPVKNQAEHERALVQGLNKLLVVVENYPDLKASRNFLELQRELSNTEDRIQAARRFYNGNVRENNNLVESFPSNLIASMGGFRLQDFFEVESAAVREVPVVSM